MSKRPVQEPKVDSTNKKIKTEEPDPAPKTLWRMQDSAYGSLSAQHSGFQQKFKEKIFDDSIENVLERSLSSDILMGLKSSVFSNGSIVEAIVTRTDKEETVKSPSPKHEMKLTVDRDLQATSSTDGAMKIVVGNDLDKSVATACIPPVKELSQDKRTATPPGRLTAAVCNYMGGSFGQDQAPQAPSYSQGSIPVSPFNPWFLSKGVPNFAKVSKCHSSTTTTSSQFRRTPDSVLRLLGSHEGDMNSLYNQMSQAESLETLLHEEKLKTRRLENVLLRVLLPGDVQDAQDK